MLCPICEKRKPGRFCPTKVEKICSVCCGTEREVSIDCPSNCAYLVSAHRYEDQHPCSLPADTPLLDARLTSDLAAASASFSKRFGEMENHEASAKSEIRSNILQQSKELHDAIRQKADDMTSLLERRFAELHHAKTDRAALASLFSEVALRLSDQFKVPGAE